MNSSSLKNLIKKMPLVTASIIVIIVILGVVGYYFLICKDSTLIDSTKKTPTIPQVLTYTQKRAQVEEINIKNASIYNRAMQDQDPKLCDQISDTAKKIECHDMITATQAKKTGTITQCDTLTSTGTILLCRDVIWGDQAIAKNDAKLCNNISERDRQSFCKESIDDKNLREHIIAHTVTREFCATLNTGHQSECLSEIREINESSIYKNAISENNIKICTQISNRELRDTCQNTINLKLAVSTENASLCEALSDPEKKRYCQNQVSKSSDISLYKGAIAGSDITKCEEIQTPNLKNKCHDSIIITTVKNTKDTSLCTNLTNTGIVKSCQQIAQ